MNQEIKEKWTAALRSGEYEQGKGRLCTIESGVVTWCCLGVLCDVVEGVEWNDANIGDPTFSYRIAEYGDGSNGHALPDTLRPVVGIPDGDEATLINMNDGEWVCVTDGTGGKFVTKTFAQIADWIDENL